MANYKQLSLLSPSKVTEVYLREDHQLVQITELLDWDELILMAMNCRSAKVKRETGTQPKYRELLGAIVLRVSLLTIAQFRAIIGRPSGSQEFPILGLTVFGMEWQPWLGE